jgi:tRNA modification GTPase
MHGSPVAMRLCLEELFKLGARQALPGEFTKRAFINGKMDLSSAEAVIDLIDAETEEFAKNAASQLGGAVMRKINEIYSALSEICSHYFAFVDYPDEDIEPFLLEEYRDKLLQAASELERLLGSFERGKIMKNGIKAAIILAFKSSARF